MAKKILISGLSAVLFFCLVGFVYSGVKWAVDGTTICSTYVDLAPQITTDGDGGAIITWTDKRSDSDIYAQRVDKSGNIKWAVNGVAISTAERFECRSKIVSDGTGGAIIVWEYAPPSLGYRDIYAQRISSDGTVLWRQNGIVVRETDDVYPYEIEGITSDGKGGAFISWWENRYDGTDENVYVQRILSTGSYCWDRSGVNVFAASNKQWHSSIVNWNTSETSFGVGIVWEDERGADKDIYVGAIFYEGTEIGNEVPLCSASDKQEFPKIAKCGQCYGVAVWQDYRSGNNYDIYARKVRFSDLWREEWGSNDGIAVCTASGNQKYPEIVNDGSDNFIIVWQDSRNGNTDIYAQKISSNGVVLWQQNGVPICTAEDTQDSHQVVSDGFGGAIIVWRDNRRGNSNSDIYAQRIDKDGNVLWQTNGLPICTASTYQQAPVMVRVSSGVAIIAWLDESFVYAQKLSIFGPTVSSVEPAEVMIGETTDITVKGSEFYSQSTVTFSGSGIKINSINFVSEEELKLNITVDSSADLGKRDITITNPDGLSYTKQSSLEVKSVKKETVDPTQEKKIEINPATGKIEITIPANTFSEQVNVSVKTVDSPASNVSTIKPTNIAIEITTDKNLQPNKEITITMYYRDQDVAGFDETKLVIARYDDKTKRWITLPSEVDTNANKVVGRTNHLSKFGIVQLSPANNLNELKVYPNPYNPKKHSQGLTIDGLTEEATIKIYTITGELLRKVEYGSKDGRAVWDGKNDSGEKVSSGVYIISVDSGKEKKIIKVALEK